MPVRSFSTSGSFSVIAAASLGFLSATRSHAFQPNHAPLTMKMRVRTYWADTPLVGHFLHSALFVAK